MSRNLQISNSFANKEWISFVNYEAMVLNFVLSWKEKLNFPTLLYNIKRAIIICRILQFFAKLFSNLPLFLWKTTSKKGFYASIFKHPLTYYGKIFLSAKTFYDIINKLLMKTCKNSLGKTPFEFLNWNQSLYSLLRPVHL